MRSFVIAMGVVGSTLSMGISASAATLQACEQSVEYAIEPPGADVPDSIRSFSGVWVGKMDTGLCVATVVQSIKPDGTAQIIYINGSMGGQYSLKAGNRKMGAKIAGGKLTWSGTNVSTDYTLRGTNELQMNYSHNTGGRFQGLLKRQ